MNTFKVRWIIAAASLAAAASAVQADSVCYVDDDAPAGGDGASWATAHRFLELPKSKETKIFLSNR